MSTEKYFFSNGLYETGFIIPLVIQNNSAAVIKNVTLFDAASYFSEESEQKFYVDIKTGFVGVKYSAVQTCFLLNHFALVEMIDNRNYESSNEELVQEINLMPKIDYEKNHDWEVVTTYMDGYSSKKEFKGDYEKLLYTCKYKDLYLIVGPNTSIILTDLQPFEKRKIYFVFKKIK